MSKTSSFKYLNISNIISRVRQLGRFGCYYIWDYKIYSKTRGESSEGFFRWKTEYGEHSKVIGKIIYEGWRKGSTLYASAQYVDGELRYDEPKDPDIPKFGLAELHFIKGYPGRWQLYKTVRAESVDICRKIKEIIGSYENVVLSEIDNDISTPNGNRKLEGKIDEEVFDVHGYYPPKLDSNGLYLFHRILAELFEETNNRNNKKKEKLLWLSNFADIWDLKIGESELYAGRTIGLGNKEMMEELKRRVETLLENPVIQQLVKDYYCKKSELEARENARLDTEIKHMWDQINSRNAFLKGEGSCENLAECRRNQRSRSEGIQYVS